MQELILVVDDEPKVVRLARDYLEKHGYRVISAGDGPAALTTARSEKPDLVILDLMLPRMDGRDVCRTLRQESDVPIIMLTALTEESDQIVGLELGADDYITKPFSPRTLVARVRALLRRTQGQIRTPEVLREGGLEINMPNHSAQLDGRTMHLTPTEFKLLVALARHTGQTLTREQLMDDVYGTAGDSFDRSVDSHIKNLRKKLDTNIEGREYIETVYGIGYRFKLE
jgi:two-component system alkaline phosphatase synthesis response regulator PhoP